jgi:hypothetical protein
VTPNIHQVHHSASAPTIRNLSDTLLVNYSNDVNWTALRYGLDGIDELNRQKSSGIVKETIYSRNYTCAVGLKIPE